MRSISRAVLIALGTIFVALGMVGMFVPILPTTPFLLLAAACYARSSERFLNWLLTNRYFGSYVRNYREGRGMPLSTKILTLAALWATLTMSAVFATTAWWLRSLLAAVGLGVTVHLLRLKTLDPESEGLDARHAPSPAAPAEDP